MIQIVLVVFSKIGMWFIDALSIVFPIIKELNDLPIKLFALVIGIPLFILSIIKLIARLINFYKYHL